MAPISEASLELEAKRRKDGSWHPCRVSLSSNDAEVGIVVDFENFNDKDIITNREDALARLRFRSKPLQDGECLHIKEGECVLAMYKGQPKSMPFDAVIEKPYRVRHSNRVFCRCTFEVKWLIPELEEETMIVPSKSIMKLSNESIEEHPIFTGFLNAFSPTGGRELSSLVSLYEDADSEADLHGILEKQIEEISRLADESKESSKDSLLEVGRVKHDGGKHRKPVVSSSICSNSGQNTFRRTTRSQNKQQVETECDKDLQVDKHHVNHVKKDLVEDKTFISPLKKDSVEDKSFLSPLAARAAFASLIYETPVKAELSACHVVERDSNNYIKVHSLNLKCEYMKSEERFQDRVPSVSEPVQDIDSDSSGESEGAFRCSNRKGATKKAKLKKSREEGAVMQASEETKCVEMSSLSTVNNSPVPLKLSGRAVTTRLTRSSAAASSEKATSPMNTARVTRSGKQLEKSNPGVNQEVEKTDTTQDARNIHGVTSPVTTTRVTRSRKAQDTHDNPEVTKPVNTATVTRSGKQMDISKPSANQDRKRSVRALDTLGTPEELVTKNNNGSKMKRLNSSEDPNAELAQEKSKRTRASSSSATTKAESGANLEDGENAPSKKMPNQRFSPRLPPRTRSQTKA